MRGIRKNLRRLFLLTVAVTALLASSIVSFAAGGVRMTKLQVGSSASGKFKTVSKAELYVNGESAAIDPEIEGVKVDARPESVELEVNAMVGSAKSGEYIITSSDRKIASVVRLSNDLKDADYYKIKITAGEKTGKAVITLTDKYNYKKKTKVTVTVKSLAEEVTTGGNVVNGEMYVAKGGKLSLGVAVDKAVSNKKLKYTVLSQKVWSDGEYVAAGKKTTIVKVDGKGNVTGKNYGMATIRISAQDQKYVNGKKKVTYGAYTDVDVYVKDSVVKTISIINPGKNAKGKYDVINMKSNTLDSSKTFRLVAEAYDGDGELLDSDSVIYISNKSSVAKVDDNGVITAVGKGTAKISVVPADGSKVKKAATVTVKVTTDVERINIPDNDIVVLVGKSQKLGATVDKNVSNKKLTYSVPQCYDADGNEIALDPKNKNRQNTISVSGSGVIKGLKEGTAAFVVSSKDGGASRKVNVTVIDPVKTLKATVPVYKKNGLSNGKSTTLYLKETYGEGEEIFESCRITTEIKSKSGKSYALDDDKVKFTSSNNKVATVDEDGVIEAKSAGKATITVEATDGSKKKATIKVTVQSKVNDIVILANTSDDELYVADNTSVTLNAIADAKASNKKLSYSFVAADGFADSVKLKGNKITAKNVATDSEVLAGVLTVAAKDATAAPKQNAYSEAFNVYVIAEGTYITKSMINIEGAEGLSLKKGTKSSALAELVDVPSEITNRELVWKSDAGNVLAVDKNGVLTAKKAGVATINVSAKKQGVESASSSVKVRVAESQAEFKKSVDDKVNFVVTSESYNWMGMKPEFDRKKSAITVDIVDVTKERQDAYDAKAEIKNVLSIFAEAMAEVSYRAVDFYDETTGVNWTVRREGAALKIYKGKELIATKDVFNVSSAVATLADAMCEDADTLAAWNGKSFEVTLLKENKQDGFDTLEYEAVYTVKFTAADNAVDALVDARTKKALAAFNNNKAATGINSMTYDAATNTTIVDIADGGKSVADASAAAKADAITALKSIFAEASVVSLEVQGMPALDKDEMTFVRKDSTNIDAAIEKLIDRLNNKLSGKITNLSGVTGVTVRADVTFEFAGETCELEYYVTFTRSLDSIDDNIDETVAAEIAKLNAQNKALGKITYDAANNNVTIGIKAADKDITELEGMGVIGLIQTILQKQHAVSAKVVADGDTTEFGNVNEITAIKLLTAIADEDDIKLGHLIGKRVMVEVCYDADDDSKSLVYVIDFATAQSDGGTQDGDDVTGTQDGSDATKTQDGDDVTGAQDGSDK